jgi:hypothetical protein
MRVRPPQLRPQGQCLGRSVQWACLALYRGRHAIGSPPVVCSGMRWVMHGLPAPFLLCAVSLAPASDLPPIGNVHLHILCSGGGSYPFYSGVNTASGCPSCVAGTFRAEGSTSAMCEACAAGHDGELSYANALSYSATGAAACTPCSAVGSVGGTGCHQCVMNSGVCTSCLRGRYMSAGACTNCPSGAPYSPLASTSAGACSACSSVAECADLTQYGRAYSSYPCPDSTWTQWFDTAGGEVYHSCLKLYNTPSVWSTANKNCANLGSGIHLLTMKQVGAPSASIIGRGPLSAR